MKRFMVLVVAVILCITNLPVFAEDAALSVSAYCDSAARSLVVTGSVSGRDGAVYLTVAAYGTELDSEAVSDRRAIVTVARAAGAEGVFEKTILLPTTFSGGKYILKATSGGETAEAEFSYINRSDAEAVIDRINNNSSVEGVIAAIGENIGSFGIDAAFYEANRALIASVLSGRIPSGGYTYETFLPELNSALAAAELAEGKNGVDAIISHYVPDAVDLEKDWTPLAEPVKDRLKALLGGADFSKEPFGVVYKKSLLLAEIAEAGDFTALRTVITTRFDIAGLDISKYYALPTAYAKDYAMQQLFQAKLTSFDAIKPAYDAAIARAAALGSGDSTSSGSGGGGGGSHKTNSGSVIGGLVVDGKTDSELAKPPAFRDMSTHWAKAEVEKLGGAGIISGYEDGTFRPDETVTRAEFAAMAAKLLMLSDDTAAGLSDVPEDSWFAPYVNACVNAGIVTGADGAFRPEETITRQDAAVILYRVLKSRGVKMTGQSSFSDEEEIAPYARGAVEALAAAGVVNGSEGRFQPAGTATRAEAAAMLCRTMLKFD